MNITHNHHHHHHSFSFPFSLLSHPSHSLSLQFLSLSMSSPPQPPVADPPAAQPPQRKFPAPCWTQEETLALINAYQDKWYSLRRRNLRTTDWDAVADEVTRRCPNVSPRKTSAQCRHKMEKLRKRYRTEKQRSLSFLPNNGGHSRFVFSSSWIFFDLMDSMEAGSSGSGSGSTPQNPPIIKPDLDQKPLNLNGKLGFDKEGLNKYFDEILTDMAVINKDRSHGSGSGSGGGPIKFKVKNHRYEDDFSHDDSGFKRKSYGGFDSPPLKKSPNGFSKRDSVADMVASINMLGEGLMKMEKMKMEMMREIETMRMEMEMKRSEMILESQQLIVNAFVEGLKNNKKVKSMEVE